MKKRGYFHAYPQQSKGDYYTLLKTRTSGKMKQIRALRRSLPGKFQPWFPVSYDEYDDYKISKLAEHADANITTKGDTKLMQRIKHAMSVLRKDYDVPVEEIARMFNYNVNTVITRLREEKGDTQWEESSDEETEAVPYVPDQNKTGPVVRG